jgi:hypothetical protein
MSSNTTDNRDFGTWEVDGIYKDEGCPINPLCMTCPLPFCVYDLPHNSKVTAGYFARAKQYPVVAISESANHLAKLTNVNIRTAFRLRRLYKESGGDYVKFLEGN